MERASGILLHPTSLPGRFGIGEFNDDAYRFVDMLAEMGQKLWQVLPLGPTGYGDSPYQCFSAFAGNPLLISLERLARENALAWDDLKDAPDFPADRVEYGEVIDYKFDLLHRSYIHFMQYASPQQHEAFEAFCDANAAWLDDYALFIALKDAHAGDPWTAWQDDVARRTPTALTRSRSQLANAIQKQKYYQFQFFQQWSALKRYANEKGVKIIGDIPIFVAFDSADVWSHREFFYLDQRGNPTVIAGVPPDYFSPTGQRWGNPLYRWDVMAQQGYAWWIERCRSAFALFDYVRIDHFRGFESYWEVPADEPTAVNGRWVKGPGKALFQAIKAALGDLPIIAETWASSRRKLERCATRSASPACACCSLPSSPMRRRNSCRTTTCATRWPMSAPTTTTQRGAGSRNSTRRRASRCWTIPAPMAARSPGT